MSIEIIPAIDILHGKCVRLTQGDYESGKIYNEHPLEVARQFEDAGLKRVHLVDLDGAKEGRVKNWNVLETIAGKTGQAGHADCLHDSGHPGGRCGFRAAAGSVRSEAPGRS